MEGWQEVQGKRRGARRRSLDSPAVPEEPPDVPEGIPQALPTSDSGASTFSPLASSRVRLYPFEAGALPGGVPCGDDAWEVVVDRTFIDILPTNGGHEALFRCKSAPADLGTYSLYAGPASDTAAAAASQTAAPHEEEPTKSLDSEALLEAAATVQRLELLLQQRDAELEELRARPAQPAAAAEIQGLQQLLRQRAEELEKLQVNHTGLQQLLQQRAEELEKLQVNHTGLQQLLRQRDKDLEKLQASYTGLQQQLQQRDKDLEKLRGRHKDSSDVVEMRKVDSERERLLRERDKEVRVLNQRLSAVEKMIAKRDVELKKRDLEISKQKESLEQRDTELAAKKQQLEELRASTECRIESLPLDGQIEVVVRHAIEEKEIRVAVSQDATFYELKKAIAEHLGSNDILKRGRLLRKHRGAYAAYSDSAAVGSVRSLLVLGISMQRTAGSSAAASAKDLQARIAELQADSSKKDSVLRKALAELKRLREEKEAGFDCASCRAAQDDAVGRRKTQSGMGERPESSTALPGAEADAVSAAPPAPDVTSLWRTLLDSRADLKEKEECASCEPATEPGSGACSDSIECDSTGGGTAFSAQASGCEPSSASLAEEMCAESVGGDSSSVISVIQGSGEDMMLDQVSEQGSSNADAGPRHDRMNSFAAKLAAQRAKKVNERMAKTAAMDALAARMMKSSSSGTLQLPTSSTIGLRSMHQQSTLSSRMRPVRRQIAIGSGIEPMWLSKSTYDADAASASNK